MSFDNKDGDDKYKDYRDSFDEEEGPKQHNGYDDGETGEEDGLNRSGKKDLEDDFFKDEDFEFSDYSGDDIEESGYRSRKIRERKKRKKLIYTSFAILLIIVVVAAGIVFGYRWIRNRFFSPAEVAEEQRITVPESLELGQDLNIVIAGSGEDLLEPEINSIIFTSYYSAGNETRSLCMPVKMLMDVPGIGAELIGKSVEIGGMDLLALTLEKGLGMDMKVDHYILMDVSGIVNRLGGIELDADQAYVIKNYSDGSTFNLEPGPNLLDGPETLNILKYFSGIERDIPLKDLKMQKKVMDTLIASIAGEDEETLADNINLVKDFIDSDLSLEEQLKLFSTFANIGQDNNLVYVIDTSSTELEGEGIVYLPDVGGISGLFDKEREVTEDAVTGEETVSVIILNGVGTPGIAQELADILNSQVYESGMNKFSVPPQSEGGIGNADNFNYASTEIIVYSTDEASVMSAANELKEIITVGNITVSEEGTADSDIVIILGADYNADASAEAEPVEVGGIVQMVILNGEGTAKLASTVEDILENHFNSDNKVIEVVETRDADNWNHTQTEIIIYTDDEKIEAFARQVQERLGVGAIKKSDNNIDNVDMTVLLGSDYTSQ